MTALRFFDPYAPLHVHERNLPHWEQEGVGYFLTWRLWDSLPAGKLATWRNEKDIWIERHPRPWDVATMHEYRARFSGRIENWLDAGSGSCLLERTRVRSIVEGALRHFDSKRYVLDSFVIMPNHVHVVILHMRCRQSLAKVLHSWKSFSARQINRLLGRQGPLWQDGYWDRILRDEAHLFRCREYIRNNPVRANLAPDKYTLFLRDDGE